MNKKVTDLFSSFLGMLKSLFSTSAGSTQEANTEERPVPRGEVTILKGNTVVARETGSKTPFQVITGSPEGIKNLGNKQSDPIGYCIYCSATGDLQSEHIVPFGLSPLGPNGTAVLPKASCARCARITGAFERQVLRGPMRAVRVLRKLRSRSKHAGAPVTQQLKVVRNGVEETVGIPIDQYPILLHFPTFPPPRVLTGEGGSGIVMTGVSSVLFGPRPDDVARRLGGQKIILESKGDRPVEFARMLAKIGYAMAAAEGAQKRLDGPSPILPSILGDVDDIGRWVGTLPDPIRKYPGLLHRIALREDRDKGLLLAEIQLFADSETPSYVVILGALRAEASSGSA